MSPELDRPSNHLLENKTIVEESSENEDETDTAQPADSIEEQYAMHLQRGKQIRKELLERLSNGSGGPGQVRFHQQQ